MWPAYSQPTRCLPQRADRPHRRPSRDRADAQPRLAGARGVRSPIDASVAPPSLQPRARDPSLAHPARLRHTRGRPGGRVSALEIRRAVPETPNVDPIIVRLLKRGLMCRPSRGRYVRPPAVPRLSPSARESHRSIAGPLVCHRPGCGRPSPVLREAGRRRRARSLATWRLHAPRPRCSAAEGVGGPIGSPPLRARDRSPIPRNRPREQNIVVLAMAPLVREAIEAEDSDEPEPAGQRLEWRIRPVRPAHAEASVASSSAA